MNLHKLILTENACYKAGKKITVKGIMVHSTGANNPWLKRYVGPDDGLLGKNQYNNHWNTYHPGGREVCVHRFLGITVDGTPAAAQTTPISALKFARTDFPMPRILMPFTRKRWNCALTSANSTV